MEKKKWYQKKTLIAAGVALIGAITYAAFEFEMSADLQAALVEIITEIAGE